MDKIKEFFRSPHIQVALATGLSIIVTAFFSKRILPHPIGYLPASLPPFLMVIFEAVYAKNKKSRYANPKLWVFLILLSTTLVILLSAL